MVVLYVFIRIQFKAQIFNELFFEKSGINIISNGFEYGGAFF